MDNLYITHINVKINLFYTMIRELLDSLEILKEAKSFTSLVASNCVRI